MLKQNLRFAILYNFRIQIEQLYKISPLCVWVFFASLDWTGGGAEVTAYCSPSHLYIPGGTPHSFPTNLSLYPPSFILTSILPPLSIVCLVNRCVCSVSKEKEREKVSYFHPYPYLLPSSIYISPLSIVQ